MRGGQCQAQRAGEPGFPLVRGHLRSCIEQQVGHREHREGLLAELGRLFRRFANGPVFDPAIPRQLGRVGWLAFSSCAATVVCKTVVTLLMTSANPPGHRMLTIGVDSQALAGLMFGFLFLVFSLVMQEALGLAEENRSFV